LDKQIILLMIVIRHYHLGLVEKVVSSISILSPQSEFVVAA